MSGSRRPGPSCHGSRAKIAMAVFTAMVMIAAVPLSASSDSEAFTDGEVGYTVEIREGATDGELSALGYSTSSMLMDVVGFVCPIFDDYWIHGETVGVEASAGTYTFKEGSGSVMSDGLLTGYRVESSSFDGFSMKYTFDDTYYAFASELNDGQVTVATQIYKYLDLDEGWLNKGDTIEFTGDCSFRRAGQNASAWGMVNDTQCVETREYSTEYLSLSYNVTAEYVSESSLTSKKITLKGSNEWIYDREETAEFASDLSDLSPGDEYTCRVSYSDDRMERSDHVVMGSKDMEYQRTVHGEGFDYTLNAEFTDASTVTAEVVIPDAESSANTTVDKTYSAFSDAYDDTVDEIIDEYHVPWILYIGIGLGTLVIAVAAALGAVLVLRGRR